MAPSDQETRWSVGQLDLGSQTKNVVSPRARFVTPGPLQRGEQTHSSLVSIAPDAPYRKANQNTSKLLSPAQAENMAGILAHGLKNQDSGTAQPRNLGNRSA